MQTTAAQAAQAAVSRASSIESPPSSKPRSIDLKVDDRLLARFILRMTLIYGHAWVSLYGDSIETPGAEIWSRSLAELTPDQIRIGIEACEKSLSEWPPSIPKFRAMALQIPSLAQVRFTIAQKTPDRFVQLVRSKLDSYAFARADQRLAELMIRDAYDLAVIAVTNGEPLPEILTEIAAPQKPEYKPPSPETVAKARDEIEAIIGTTEGMVV